jgi:RNA recognition motif-containing protein
MKLYVGKLPLTATESDLTTAFSAHGKVESASIVKDKSTGAARGFAFVVMPDSAEANKAIAALNGKSIAGGAVEVNEAKSKGDAPTDKPAMATA